MKNTLPYFIFIQLALLQAPAGAEQKQQENFKLKFEHAELKKMLSTNEGAMKGRSCIFLVGEIRNISKGDVFIELVGNSTMISRGSFNYYWKKNENEDWQSLWHAGSSVGGKLLRIPPGGTLLVNRFIARSDVEITDMSPKQERVFTTFGVMIRIFGSDKNDGDRYLMMESIVKLKPEK